MVARDRDRLEQIIRIRGRFSHREHLELAWTFLGDYSLAGAEQAMAAAIQHIASSHGRPEKYHDTLTRCWVRLVAAHRATDSANDFDTFLDGNQGLLDRDLVQRHYSPELLGSGAARSHWAEPDTRPLPVHA